MKRSDACCVDDDDDDDDDSNVDDDDDGDDDADDDNNDDDSDGNPKLSLWPWRFCLVSIRKLIQKLLYQQLLQETAGNESAS